MFETLNSDDLEVPVLQTWRGRPIKDLSRNELLEVVFFLAHHYQETMTPLAIKERAKGRVAMLKKGLNSHV